jgi:NAD(P)-dependent dehydrogenase (short-subunit alcohol dehydrogenase family)
MAREGTDRARGPHGDKPVVVITGAAGNLGQSIGAALARDYHVVGIDRDEADGPIIASRA